MITESKFVQWFHDPSEYSVAGFSDFPCIPWFIAGNAMGIPLGGAAAFAVSDTAGWTLLPLLIVLWNLIPNLWRFSPLNSIDNKNGQIVERYSYRGGPGSADLLRKVMALSPEDRRLFPAGLLDTLRQDLHPDERLKINRGIKDILDKIDARDVYLQDVKQKSIPIEHVLEALEDAKGHVDSDIKVYRDFL